MRLIPLVVLFYGSLWAQSSLDLRAVVNGWTESAASLGTSAEDLRYRESADGKFTLLLRHDVSNGVGARFRFEDFALPEGSQLYVYGLDKDNAVTRVDGPFTGAGPFGTGEFLTRAVPGSRVLIELQTADELPLPPFRVAEAKDVDAIEESVEIPADQPVETRVSIFRGQVVEHQVIGGMAVLEGDMLLGRVEELEAYTGDPKQAERSAGAISSTSYRWPNGIVPYRIDPAIADKTRITNAVAHWNTLLAGNLRLVEQTTETYYVLFRLAAASTCSSYIGYIRQAGQAINIGDYCSTGNVIHEIGHAIGFYHEHMRSDRDTYVQILTANIQTSALSNFNKASTLNLGTYDYGSIMHYPAYAFSANGQPTIVTIPAGIPIGQRSGLSTLDISGARLLYPATTTPPPPPPPTTTNVALTVGSNPTGRTLTVDGQSYSATTTLQVPAGSTHTVSAPNQSNGRTTYTFQNWSDGGAQTHSVVVTAARSLTATYSTSYKVKGTGGRGGDVVVSPASADEFYRAGTTITVSANAQANFCFTGWTGVTPVSDSVLRLTVNQPLDITGSFREGSVSTPSMVSVPKNGGTVSVNVSATAGCLWKATSYANWISVEGSGTGSGNAPLRLRLSANTGAGSRFGVVRVGTKYMIVSQN